MLQYFHMCQVPRRTDRQLQDQDQGGGGTSPCPEPRGFPGLEEAGRKGAEPGTRSRGTEADRVSGTGSRAGRDHAPDPPLVRPWHAPCSWGSRVPTEPTSPRVPGGTLLVPSGCETLLRGHLSPPSTCDLWFSIWRKKRGVVVRNPYRCGFFSLILADVASLG